MGFHVEINQDVCKGCGKCVSICPKALIRVEEKKALVAEPDRCDGLAGCIRRCPEGAITITRT